MISSAFLFYFAVKPCQTRLGVERVQKSGIKGSQTQQWAAFETNQEPWQLVMWSLKEVQELASVCTRENMSIIPVNGFWWSLPMGGRVGVQNLRLVKQEFMDLCACSQTWGITPQPRPTEWVKFMARVALKSLEITIVHTRQSEHAWVSVTHSTRRGQNSSEKWPCRKEYTHIMWDQTTH